MTTKITQFDELKVYLLEWKNNLKENEKDLINTILSTIRENDIEYLAMNLGQIRSRLRYINMILGHIE